MKGFILTNQKVASLKLHQKDRNLVYSLKTIELRSSGWCIKDVPEALLLDAETLRNSEYTYLYILSFIQYVKQNLGMTYKAIRIREIF